MKGAELPINTVVILVLALIVVALVVLFAMGIFTQGQSDMNDDQKRAECCNAIKCGAEYEYDTWVEIETDCNIVKSTVPQDIENEIKRIFNIQNPEDIKNKCSCPIPTP